MVIGLIFVNVVFDEFNVEELCNFTKPGPVGGWDYFKPSMLF